MDAETLAKLVHLVRNRIGYDPFLVAALYVDDEEALVEWNDTPVLFRRTMVAICGRVLEDHCDECAGPRPCVCTRDE